MGGFKQLKLTRRIVEDCMRNVHPVYHLKELMIKRELAKDETLKNENWERFLPHFKKRNIKRKKKPLVKKKKNKSIFPPEQTPRKEDIQMETGEYFVNEAERKQSYYLQTRQRQKQKTEEKRRERQKELVPPKKKAKKAGLEATAS
eukprot:GHVQ01013917.1.p2 GENE.GHVQ01013917.1~~GHVQ01013917.1.p2  ORF type:complete len:146 (+),score=28.62 GHVQ01013917.1:811-1248(+)